jgi:hypothetical protein
MSAHTAPVDELVRRFLQFETGGARDAGAFAVAVERACQQLAGELTTLVGQGGVNALMGRAVNLAKRQYPFLDTVRPRVVPDVALVGLTEAFEGREPDEVEAAGAAVLGHLVRLLVNLVGEDLGLRPVRKAWFSAMPRTESTDSGETVE